MCKQKSLEQYHRQQLFYNFSILFTAKSYNSLFFRFTCCSCSSVLASSQADCMDEDTKLCCKEKRKQQIILPKDGIAHLYYCLCQGEQSSVRLCVCVHVLRGAISPQLCQIDAWSQWTTHRKSTAASQKLTSPMTSRDPERSRSQPHYLWGTIFWQRCQIDGETISSSFLSLVFPCCRV